MRSDVVRSEEYQAVPWAGARAARFPRWLCALTGAVASLALGTGRAVDGVIEINDARALAGGVTATDAPGYPVTLDRPGSYRLTGDLAPTGSPAAVVGLIASGISLDLNGFTISGEDTDEAAATVGIRAQTNRRYARVANGFVRATGGVWAVLLDSESQVSNLTIVDNAGVGINCNLNCTVTDSHIAHNGGGGITVNHNAILTGNKIVRNDGDGIVAEIPALIKNNLVNANAGSGIVTLGGLIANNLVLGNARHGVNADRPQPGIVTAPATIIGNHVVDNDGGDGIRAGDGSTVLANSVVDNGGLGLRIGASAGYAENTIRGNGDGTVSGGIEIGRNLCGNDAVCP